MEALLIFFVFILSIIIGVELITKVPPTLHTPLMSGTNAMSGITLVGALIAFSQSYELYGFIFSYIALIFAVVNVVGGFFVTDRMLKMFKKK